MAPCSSQKNSGAYNILHLLPGKTLWLMICPAFSISRASGRVTALGLHSSQQTWPRTHMPGQQLAEWSSPVEKWPDYRKASAMLLISKGWSGWEALAWQKECSVTFRQFSAFSTECAMLARMVRVGNTASSIPLSPNLKMQRFSRGNVVQWYFSLGNRELNTYNMVGKMQLLYSPMGSKLLFYSDLYCLVLINIISNLYH